MGSVEEEVKDAIVRFEVPDANMPEYLCVSKDHHQLKSNVTVLWELGKGKDNIVPIALNSKESKTSFSFLKEMGKKEYSKRESVIQEEGLLPQKAKKEAYSRNIQVSRRRGNLLLGKFLTIMEMYSGRVVQGLEYSRHL